MQRIALLMPVCFLIAASGCDRNAYVGSRPDRGGQDLQPVDKSRADASVDSNRWDGNRVKDGPLIVHDTGNDAFNWDAGDADKLAVLDSHGLDFAVDAVNKPDGALVQWTLVPTGVQTDIYGIHGTSGSDIWAVGPVAGGSGVVLHYDGGSWTAGNVSSAVMAVWAVSSQDVWAAAGALHNSGTGWVNDTKLTGQIFHLWASSGSDVWVARPMTGGPNWGEVLHYNGSGWPVVHTEASTELFGIWGAASNKIWAVGNTGKIIMFDGANWSVQASGTTDPLWAVWGIGPSDVWAVGHTSILHYDGSTWSKVHQVSSLNSLRCVWASSASDVWAVGKLGGAFHFDGKQWAQVLVSAPQSQDLWGVWGSAPNDVWIVGNEGVALHYH